MFASYAAIVKNLRGVALFNPNENVNEIIKWLVDRFRYRNIGIPEELKNRGFQTIKKYLKGNPFITIDYPIEHLREFPIFLSEIIKIDKMVVDAIFLSSIYISPLLVLGESYIDKISNFLVDHVNVRDPLDNRMWKLHFRIADYTILDLYNECVNEGFKVIELIKRGKFEDITYYLESRAKRISRDKKRYWRIISDKGELFLGYIDNLKIFYSAVKQSSKIRLYDDYAAFMAIVPAVFINKKLIGK